MVDFDEWVDVGFENFEEIFIYFDEMIVMVDENFWMVVWMLLDFCVRVVDFEVVECEWMVFLEFFWIVNVIGEKKVWCEDCGEIVYLDLFFEFWCLLCWIFFCDLLLLFGFFGLVMFYIGCFFVLELVDLVCVIDVVEDLFDEVFIGVVDDVIDGDDD